MGEGDDERTRCCAVGNRPSIVQYRGNGNGISGWTENDGNPSPSPRIVFSSRRCGVFVADVQRR